ncbi:hypothetical protein ACHAXA_003332 [Cyclostephanos tholiformis]|uniref:Uncharacterized protein n=1 Tax=Cyclostephanos tholiformis TaxID=382380 RepID=A0ABD3SBR0_9STRA
MLDPARRRSFENVFADIKATTAIALLESSQTLTVAKITLSIPDLALKPDACYDSSSSDLVIGSSTVKLRAFDAPGPANVAWLSDLCVDLRLSSLTIYSGPLTNVPHLISRCSTTGGGGGGGATDDLSLFIDFRQRGEEGLRDKVRYCGRIKFPIGRQVELDRCC